MSYGGYRHFPSKGEEVFPNSFTVKIFVSRQNVLHCLYPVAMEISTW